MRLQNQLVINTGRSRTTLKILHESDDIRRKPKVPFESILLTLANIGATSWTDLRHCRPWTSRRCLRCSLMHLLRHLSSGQRLRTADGRQPWLFSWIMHDSSGWGGGRVSGNQPIYPFSVQFGQNISSCLQCSLTRSGHSCNIHWLLPANCPGLRAIPGKFRELFDGNLQNSSWEHLITSQWNCKSWKIR